MSVDNRGLVDSWWSKAQRLSSSLRAWPVARSSPVSRTFPDSSSSGARSIFGRGMNRICRCVAPSNYGP